MDDREDAGVHTPGGGSGAGGSRHDIQLENGNERIGATATGVGAEKATRRIDSRERVTILGVR